MITSEFGSGRLFNGRMTSRHLGVDFRGAVGEPVLATNRGVVALVDNFFLAGNVVYIDHGGGVVTAYFHLSKPLAECLGSILTGVVLGTVALRTGSIFGGVAVHCVVAWGMDLSALAQKGKLASLFGG